MRSVMKLQSVAALACALGTVLPGHAAEPVVVLEWAGTAALETAYPGSPMGRALNQAEPLDLAAVLRAVEALPNVGPLGQNMEPEARAKLAMLAPVAAAVWRDGVSLTMVQDAPETVEQVFDWGNISTTRTPHGFVVRIPTSEAADAFMRAFAEADGVSVQAAAESITIRIARDGLDPAELVKVEAGEGLDLTFDQDAPLRFMVATQPLLEGLTTATHGKPQAVLDALNLRGWSMLALTMRLTEAGVVTELRLPGVEGAAPAGLPELLAAGELDLSLAEAVPVGAVQASLNTVSLPATLELVEAVAEAVDPGNGAVRVSGALDTARQMFGADLRGGWVENLGDTWLRVQAPQTAGLSLLSTVWVNRPVDASAADEVLTRLFGVYSHQSRNAGPFIPPVVRREVDGVAVQMLQGPGLSVVAAVVDGHWLLGLDERAVAAVGRHLLGDAEPTAAWLPTGEASAGLRALVQAAEPGTRGLAAVDPRPGLAQVYPLVSALNDVVVGGAASLTGSHKGLGLPPLQGLVEPLPLSTMTTTADGGSLRITWVSGIPGTELLANGYGGALMPNFLSGFIAGVVGRLGEQNPRQIELPEVELAPAGAPGDQLGAADR